VYETEAVPLQSRLIGVAVETERLGQDIVDKAVELAEKDGIVFAAGRTCRREAARPCRRRACSATCSRSSRARRCR